MKMTDKEKLARLTQELVGLEPENMTHFELKVWQIVTDKKATPEQLREARSNSQELHPLT